MIQAVNDSKRELSTPLLVAVNVTSALISAAFGAVALVDPAASPGIDGGVTSTANLYAAMYGVRALPIAAAIIWLALADRRRLVPVLLLAGVAQIGDIIIGTATATVTMALGATIAAIIHLGSAWLLRASE
jgi:hypothetical protein